MPRRSDTKKRILFAAIECFAAKSYRACTMQEIAERVGVRASSLYKHYAGKEEILQSILDYFKIHFNMYRTPPGAILEAAKKQPVHTVIPMMFFNFGTDEEQEIMLKIMRIVADLRFENAEIRQVYMSVFIEESREYLYRVFGGLIEQRLLPPFDYPALVIQMIGFTHLVLNLRIMQVDTKKEIELRFQEGIAWFARYVELALAPPQP